jgi:hypothetical protein
MSCVRELARVHVDVTDERYLPRSPIRPLACQWSWTRSFASRFRDGSRAHSFGSGRTQQVRRSVESSCSCTRDGCLLVALARREVKRCGLSLCRLLQTNAFAVQYRGPTAVWNFVSLGRRGDRWSADRTAVGRLGVVVSLSGGIAAKRTSTAPVAGRL